MARKDELGRRGEERAAQHLAALGWRIIDRNWRCPDGEIDIVARCGDDLVVVEVKTRTGLAFGHPLEAVDARKLDRLWRLGRAWAAAHAHDARGTRLRVDAVAIVGPDPATARLEHLRGLR